VSDVSSDDEKVPEAVPITNESINHETRDADSNSISEVDIDDYGSSSEEYDSDELNVDSTANPHGFVYANMLETFQRSRTDRLEDMREEAEDKKADHRLKFKKKPNSKKIGKTERVHAKNKPFMMIKKKKISELRDKMSNNKPTKHKVKRQLGHFRKCTK